MNPANTSQSVTTTYTFISTSNYTAFDIEDIEYKPDDMQHEMVSIVGHIGIDTILPRLYSLSGSVDIQGNSAIGTSDSSVGFDESILVIFDEAIDGFSVIQSNVDNSSSNPGTSKIYIGRSIGVYTGECGISNSLILPCTDELLLNDTLISDSIYQARYTLESNAEIVPNLNVSFKAGSSILLYENFEVKENTTFALILEGCN